MAAHPECLRTRSLSAVDAELSRNAHRFGVARISDLTRLDSLGISTIAVTRADPLGESVSVCTGKGASPLEARVGALGEALERYCGEPRGRISITTARASALAGLVLSPASLVPSVALDEEAVLDWCDGRLLDGRRIWVPANAVLMPYAPAASAERLFSAHTHGLALGSTTSEALVHGLLECIERDCYSRAVALATVGRGDSIPMIDPATAASDVPQIAAIERAGLRVVLRDLTCDTRVPAMLCVIHDGDVAHMGVAAHLDSTCALRKAVVEAAQSRLTDIQGAREDLPPREQRVDPWFLGGSGGLHAWTPVRFEDSVEAALALLATRLSEAELSPVAYVDLSLDGIDLCVVRVVVPGAETWAFDPTRSGKRAAAWLEA